MKCRRNKTDQRSGGHSLAELLAGMSVSLILAAAAVSLLFYQSRIGQNYEEQNINQRILDGIRTEAERQLWMADRLSLSMETSMDLSDDEPIDIFMNSDKGADEKAMGATEMGETETRESEIGETGMEETGEADAARIRQAHHMVCLGSGYLVVDDRMVFPKEYYQGTKLFCQAAPQYGRPSVLVLHWRLEDGRGEQKAVGETQMELPNLSHVNGSITYAQEKMDSGEGDLHFYYTCPGK